jgi:hypothetical protein
LSTLSSIFGWHSRNPRIAKENDSEEDDDNHHLRVLYLTSC